MAEYFDMAGYAAYVWSAYGITLGIILAMIGASFWKKVRLKEAEESLLTTNEHE